jgi:hypothetical protein
MHIATYLVIGRHISFRYNWKIIHTSLSSWFCEVIAQYQKSFFYFGKFSFLFFPAAAFSAGSKNFWQKEEK